MDTFETPELETTRSCIESTMQLQDGTNLFFRAWPPTKESSGPPTAVVLFHRGHEHSGRFLDVVDHLQIEESWIFAWDQRGHGQSPGERGVAESVSQLARDADEFVRQISQTHGIPISNMAIVAHSIGAVVASAWVHDYAPPIRGLVLLTPALRVKLYVPFAIPGLRLLKKVRPNAMVKSYVRPGMLTHDPVAAKRYADDPLLSPAVSVKLLLDLHDTSTRLLNDAGAIHCPVDLHIAGRDWVVHPKAQRFFFDNLSSNEKNVHSHDKMYHDVLHELDREPVLETIGEFLRQQLQSKSPPTALTTADQNGASFDAWNRLKKPLPIIHPRRWCFGATRLVLGTLGRFISTGIRLGWDEGFNSGRMLDYVYKNQAQGFTLLGRLADRIFLDSPGWKGIRTRRRHMNEMLDEAIRRVAKNKPANQTIHILDIAAGAGRYVLDAIQRNSAVPITATLCDQEENALQLARMIAEEQGIEGVNFRQSDAFDANAIRQSETRPDIVIVSGLYELFPSNQPILASLRGIAEIISPTGWLIYTNQPWHPQQELIARSLHGYDRQLWAMRCRSSAEMDNLVFQFGFEKQQMKIDDQGIFSVSLAKMGSNVSQ